MRASAIEFRLRMPIMVALVVMGFWAPWIETLDLGRRIPLLEWLALEASRAGLLRFAYASPAVIGVATALAAAGAWLRVWGAAYLGYDTVHHGAMLSGAVMADGPYRFMRNPLYLGGWCMMAAISFLMPPTGALVALPLLTVFLLRLILGEEAFLEKQLGEPYRAYLKAVPRLIPRLRGSLPAAGHKAKWGIALLTELNPIGIFLIYGVSLNYAVLASRYNFELMLQAVLICFGVSLVVRAVMPRGNASPNPA
jgi:protein-S-isoprenylcysteine O-methyltransferase Ste14